VKQPAIRRAARLQGFDPDQLLDVVSDGHLEHFLLEPARCDAELLHWECGGVSVDVGHYSFPVRARGAFGKERFCVGYMRNISSPTWVNGFDVERDTVQFYPAGSELDYRADANGQWIAIAIEEEILQSTAMNRLGRPIDLPREGTLSHRLPQGHHQVLDRAVSRLVRQAAVDSLHLESFLGNVADVLVHVREGKVESLARKWQSRRDLLARADDYLRTFGAQPFDLSAMARAIGTSRRSLQRHFADAYAMTPLQWARCLALHRARRHLRASNSRDIAIEAVARDCGFRHMGRFAGHYRELFGELPSATLARASSDG
jgi:AraC-like DNA-binding protein